MCFLLDVTLLDSLFIQVLYELLPLHPVDERADVAAIAEKRSASEVQSASCKDRRSHAVISVSPAVLLQVCICEQPIKKKAQAPSKSVASTQTLIGILLVTCGDKYIHQFFLSFVSYTYIGGTYLSPFIRSHVLVHKSVMCKFLS